jgi:sugar O-acyltransferase (sialic acid O-acetyltransferase NeuD family)
MKPIAIYGAGGLGREVLALIRALPEWNPVCFYDDGIPNGSEIGGLLVKGGVEALEYAGELAVVVAIGDPLAKESIINRIRSLKNIYFPVLIHPTVTCLDRTNLAVGAGTVITAGCILTTAITIGSHVLVNLNCTIGHDVNVGNFVSIMPGVNIAGQVEIGNSVLIGSGAQLINHISVGNAARIGAGAVVIRDVRSKSTVVGVPAKEIKLA